MALVADRMKSKDGRAASLALSCSAAIAVAGGVLVCAILQLWGPRLLLATGADAALLGPALTYLRIRAVAAPAAILVQVAQAGLLGQRDSLSPFKVRACGCCPGCVLTCWGGCSACDVVPSGILGSGRPL